MKIQGFDRYYILFIDRIVLNICRLFNPKEKRISEDMKASLQQDSIGDWFLMPKYSVIRVYGFSDASFKLQVYLTPSVFTLELIRQRIYVDEEHFTSHRKDSWIKDPINFKPFVVKKETTLPMVEKVLKDMNFQVTHAHNYYPKGIISHRRVQV